VTIRGRGISDVATRRSVGEGLPLALDERLGIQRLTPDAYTYAEVIQACSNAGEPRLGIRVFDARVMSTTGAVIAIEPTTVMVGAVLDCCAKVGDWAKALRISELAVKSGLTPSHITTTALVSALTKGGRWKHAIDVLDEAEMSGVQMNHVAYHTILSSLGRPRYLPWEHGMTIINKMIEKEHYPDLRTYSILIAGYARARRWLQLDQTGRTLAAKNLEAPSALTPLLHRARSYVDRGIEYSDNDNDDDTYDYWDEDSEREMGGGVRRGVGLELETAARFTGNGSEAAVPAVEHLGEDVQHLEHPGHPEHPEGAGEGAARESYQMSRGHGHLDHGLEHHHASYDHLAGLTVSPDGAVEHEEEGKEGEEEKEEGHRQHHQHHQHLHGLDIDVNFAKGLASPGTHASGRLAASGAGGRGSSSRKNANNSAGPVNGRGSSSGTPGSADGPRPGETQWKRASRSFGESKTAGGGGTEANGDTSPSSKNGARGFAGAAGARTTAARAAAAAASLSRDRHELGGGVDKKPSLRKETRGAQAVQSSESGRRLPPAPVGSSKPSEDTDEGDGRSRSSRKDQSGGTTQGGGRGGRSRGRVVGSEGSSSSHLAGGPEAKAAGGDA